jgi:hypothetical protein
MCREIAIQIVDLIAVSGVYITFAMLSNTAEDATPGGKTPSLQPLPARSIFLTTKGIHPWEYTSN